jgi:hypothetical protein
VGQNHFLLIKEESSAELEEAACEELIDNINNKLSSHGFICYLD